MVEEEGVGLRVSLKQKHRRGGERVERGRGRERLTENHSTQTEYHPQAG